MIGEKQQQKQERNLCHDIAEQAVSIDHIGDVVNT